MKLRAPLSLSLLVAAPCALAPPAAVAAPTPSDDATRAPVDYRREVRPILSDKCYACHGPDEAERKLGLRLDTREGALGELKFGGHAVVPGDVEASELVYRIEPDEDEDRMPPSDYGKSLSELEKETLRRWIAEGAPWEEHWAFTPPERPAPPAVGDDAWVRNPIDGFVLAALEADGLAPTPEATPETLLRRASYTLTGLPPTLEELDRFLEDDQPGAYERAVDRLLESPRYGEEMARSWLDAARYADTHGFHIDNTRNLWHWRAWVIDAFNDNKPLDEFTVEQLAGDLLPEPTLEQRIATGFLRCNPTTGEGGLIEEEYLAKYAFDRVDTFGTVFLGMSIACAQCHDHKFDPVTQREYYGLYAFFNNLAEAGTDRNALVPPPALKVPSAEQAAQQDALNATLAELSREMESPMPAADAAQVLWEGAWRASLAQRWQVVEPLEVASRDGTELTVLEDASVLASGKPPAFDVYTVVARTDATDLRAVRLEGLTHESQPNGGLGRVGHANIVLSDFELAVRPVGSEAEPVEVALVGARADYSQKNYEIERAIDDDPKSGWAVDGRIEDRQAFFSAAEPFGFQGGTELVFRLRFESQHPQHELGRFRLALSDDADLAPASISPWRELGPFTGAAGPDVYDKAFAPEAFAADGRPGDPIDEALRWAERPDYADGATHTWTGDHRAYYVARTLEVPAARALSISLGSDDALKVWLNGEVVLDRKVARALAPDQDQVTLALLPGVNHLLMKVVNYAGGFGFTFRVARDEAGGLAPETEALLVRAPGELTEPERARLRDGFRRRHSAEWAAIADRVEATRAELARIDARIPATMVCAERADVRPAFVLKRGQYDQPGAPVQRGVPAVLGSLPDDGRPADRLSLARWLTAPEHPLFARVTANRVWQQHFGAGLVRTPEDFGSQGEWPTHPELLDWLARELVESGWDLKHLHRVILSSAAFRQGSGASPAAWSSDPRNRRLARGPRFRLEAEEIRDTALLLGGLLNEELGGPSVKPYQPAGLWKEVSYPSSNTANFKKDEGDALYRRSLYTFWKRTSPPPNLMAFDAPTRESCQVRRARTNTPLQALVLLNDVQFVETARAFAGRVLRAGGADDAARATFAFRSATSRHPDARELELLVGLVAAARSEYTRDPAAAAALLEAGDSSPDPELDPIELAAWTNLTGAVLNLDETVTRE